MTRISTHYQDMLEDLTGLAELYDEADTILPVDVIARLHSEGVFTHIPNYED